MATVKMAGTLPLNRGGVRGGGLVGASALSPESAVASEIFDQLVAATTFKAVLHLYRQICELLRLRPTNLLGFYPRLKAKLKSWKATNLWTKLDKRASHKCYNRGRACPNSRVLIIGAGPCGLRAAIECQLLGAKVVVLEKRDRFSRNNVLHLWPFVIYDLRNLGAKKFFGKFCAGSIDHISIRQLQLILLKVALLLGVEVHENVTFEQLLEPPLDQSQERVGWRAKVSPADHPVSQYEFDALIGADGKRNTLLGFNRKEFRGKLAIAVTANFINRQSMEEASVPEISGVAFIFNQKFFQDMREQTGVDLENIVYYKDDTHYFVMTAKKQSLLDQGVIINDYSDTARLLSPDNVDRQMLMRYAREAADFATNGQMPHLDFAVNHYGQADVAMFDFTSMYAAENACRMVERRGHRLLQSLVGDCLLEPFWPTGSGCARGFLSALDAAWMVRSWSSGKKTPLQVLAEREACYRLLAQTTPENLHKDLNLYTLNPTSRYPNLNLLTVLPSQVRCLCDTDTELQDHLPDVVPELLRKKRRRMSLIHPDALLSWCQRQVSLTEGVVIENLSTSWKTGLALCAILHRYRPDLVDIGSLNPADAAKNNQLAFDICEREYGIPPIMTGQEMAECEVPDKLAMVAYLTQIYDTFRGEIPYLVRPIKSVPEEATSESNQPGGLLSKFSHRLHGKRSRYSVEKESHRESGEGIKRTKTPSSLTHRRRSRDKDKGIAQNTDSEQVTLTGFNKILKQQQSREEEEQIREEVQQAIIGKDQFHIRMRELKKQLRRDEGLRSEESNDEEINHYEPAGPPKFIGKICPDDWNVKMLEQKLKSRGHVTETKRQSKVGKLQKEDWNLQRLEEKMRQQQMGPPEKEVPVPRPKLLQDLFKEKLTSMDARLKADGGLTQEESAKYEDFDTKVQQLEQQLHEGNMDVGQKGKNRVARMAKHMAHILDWDPGVKGDQKPPGPPPPVITPAKEPIQMPVRVGTVGSSSETCCFCQKRVYLMERLSAEGLFFHRSCFRCEYCGANLRLGHYAFDRTPSTRVRVFCPPHLNMQKTPVNIQKDQRFAEMMKRKHAFLSGSPLDEQQQQPSPTSSLISSASRKGPTQEMTEPKNGIQPDVTLDGATAPLIPAVATLIVPAGLDTRDRTPERVEFENSLLELSEDELLTSELEEEELTQKNFGPHHDHTTSDDEYSDLSTDTESDEDYLIEELEKSFTADGTRKLAETWQQKHEDINNTVGQKRRTSLSVKDRSDGPRRTRGEKSTGSTTPEAEDDTDDSDESDTETGGGDDTSDDIETDEEYASDDHKDEPLEEAVNCDIVMEVPVLSPNVVPEDSEEYTLSEDESDELLEVDGAEEGEGSQEDLTSSSEEEPLPPPHQIPVIVINESPPQVETDKDWAEEMASAMEEQSRNKAQKSESTELKENVPEEGILMQAVLEKLSTDTSSALTSPETCSQLIANQAEPSLLLAASLDAEEIPAECVQELVDIRQEAKEVAEELVHEIVSQAVASVSVRQELDNTKPSYLVTVFSDVEKEKANCDGTNTTELKEVLQTDSPKDSLEINSEAENTASNSEKPGDSKWDQIGKDLPPLVPGPTLNATRLSLDKFRFIAGAPSPRQQQYSPSKASISPKELASKLSEFHRKIEELQKQLPSPPVSSPPVTSSRPDFWKPRGTSPPILSCETYYQSLQEGIHVPESSSATLSKKPLPPLSFNKLDMLPKKEGVLDDSTEVPNKPVPNENSKSVDVPKETRPELCPNQALNCQGDSLPDNAPEKVKAVSPEMKRTSFDHSTEKQSDTSFDSSIDFKNELEDAKTSPVMNTSDLSDELLELSKKYSFNPAYITLRKHNKLPASHIVKKDDDARSSVENLLDLGKYKRPMPKVIGVLSGGLTNSQPELSPVPKDVHMLSATNRPLMSSTPNQNSSSSPNKADVRFQGYGGSFADKVRPRSLVGDSIYLKSLSINLQKLAFPSLTKDSSFGGSCGTLKDEELKTTPTKKLSSASKSIEDILMGSPEEKQDKFCPIGSGEQSMDHSISQSTKKEKLERVPFADDEKQSVASESVLGSVENMYNTTPNFGQSDSVYITPPNTVTKDLLLEMDEEYLLRTQRTAEQEKARQEARERARMKSDEELGLSPCNYRKRYIQASSLSLGNYDELSSDDFLDDKDDMYEDDSDNEMDGVFHEKRVAFNERVQSVEAASSQQDLAQPNFNLTSPLSGGESGNATSSEKTLTTSSCSRTDSANYMESSLSPEDLLSSPEGSKKSCTALLMPPGATLSSTESSPGTPDGPAPPSLKSKSKLKFNGDQKTEEEKPKSNGKKSFLSLLHFGRSSNSSKEKQTKNKSRSSSLPPDIRGRNKERSFALLKFTKGKDRSRDKQKKKVGDSVNESHTGAQNEQMMVVVRPKSASEPPEVNRYPPILKVSNNNNVPSAEEIVPLQAVPLNLKAVMKMENGMAPKASVDSFTDTDEEASKGLSKPLDRTIKPPPPVSALSQWTTPPAPSAADKEQRLMRMAQRVHRKQELKRFRTGQEIERRLQEIDILRKDLELKGVSCEKALRGETSVSPSSSKADVDLMQEWFALIRNRNKLEREEQELIIRMKDLELEERHSILQQEMRGRMAKSDDLKTKSDVEKERDILTEMLAIVEKRDELVLTLDQLKLREEVEDRDLENRMLASGLSPEAANR